MAETIVRILDDNVEGTLIGILDDDGDARLSIVSREGERISVEFCTRLRGGRDPEFTRAVRTFITAMRLHTNPNPRRESSNA